MSTICAISTAVGGAISVLRVSGEEAFDVAEKCWQGELPLKKLPARKLVLGRLAGKDGEIDGGCLAVRFMSPNSYTGEDVVEFHCHGGPLCARLALDALLAAGAEMAEPGEFTRRAFLNGKMDLTQAEAVQEIISAGSESAINLASRQLRGHLGNVVNGIYDTVNALLCEIESRLDFPEEDLDFQPPENLVATIEECKTEISRLASTQRCGEVLRGGISMVIAGPPNVGKSSLLNRLLGHDRAIVSDIPGTTRDTIDAHLAIRGIPIHIVDTAGIRDSGDAIEQTGIERARQNAEVADIVLWIADATAAQCQDFPGWSLRGTLVRLANKIDQAPPKTAPDGYLPISAVTGEGMDALYDAVEHAVWGKKSPEECEIAVSARHAVLLKDAENGLTSAIPLLLGEEWELAALSLRDALTAVGKISGRTVEPDLLDQIFHKFCIGK